MKISIFIDDECAEVITALSGAFTVSEEGDCILRIYKTAKTDVKILGGPVPSSDYTAQDTWNSFSSKEELKEGVAEEKKVHVNVNRPSKIGWQKSEDILPDSLLLFQIFTKDRVKDIRQGISVFSNPRIPIISKATTVLQTPTKAWDSPQEALEILVSLERDIQKNYSDKSLIIKETSVRFNRENNKEYCLHETVNISEITTEEVSKSYPVE